MSYVCASICRYDNKLIRKFNTNVRTCTFTHTPKMMRRSVGAEPLTPKVKYPPLVPVISAHGHRVVSQSMTAHKQTLGTIWLAQVQASTRLVYCIQGTGSSAGGSTDIW